jgi:DNA-binding response OmpR family regulator
VDVSHSYHEGMKMVLDEYYDLIIFDLDDKSAEYYDLIFLINRLGFSTRFLALTSVYTADVIIETLNQGADDIIAKPFSFDELYARIQSLFRRGKTTLHEEGISINDCILNTSGKFLNCHGQVINLTKTEFLIIEFLFNESGNLKSVEQIQDHLSKEGTSISRNSIEAHLSTVRRKLRQVNQTLPISNRRGLGYIAE